VNQPFPPLIRHSNRQGNLTAAAGLVHAHDLPLSEARVLLAQGDVDAALAVLEPFRRQVAEKAFEDDHLRALVLEALAHHAQDDKDQVVQLIREALALAEPGGLVRVFIDEGAPMARLLREVLARRIFPHQVRQLLAAFPGDAPGELPYRRQRPADPVWGTRSASASSKSSRSLPRG
jgi:LuxR family transcriptional regulator, maltose regulon positive regulatory protein